MFKSEVYVNRRNNLRKKLSSGIVLLLGNDDSPMNYPANPFHFRQDSNFLYFVGLQQPGLVAVLDIDAGEDILFGDNVDIDDIIWMGPQPAFNELAEKAGVQNTRSSAAMVDYVTQAIKNGRTVHFLPPYRHSNMIKINNLLGIPFAGLKTAASVELIEAVVTLRSIKDLYEIAEIEKACEIGALMHTEAMKQTREGKYESDIAGLIEGIALSKGSGVSFPVICSVHGETLHNHYHGNKLKNGDLLLTDAGAETFMNYASDYTRTYPVSGKFSEKQKEVYEIVLNANKEAIKAVKPGVKYQDIHLLASRIIADGLINIDLMKGDPSEVVAAGAHAMFFPHGLGHMMGLDVHDMEDLGENYVGYDNETSRIDQFGTAYLRLGRKLQPGFVLTVEPGIYFVPELINLWKSEKKFENFINYQKVEKYLGFGGIRIEDDVMVTNDSFRVLGPHVPKEVAELEEVIGK